MFIGLVGLVGALLVLRSAQTPDYISRAEAARIALDDRRLENAPPGLRITLRKDPPRWAGTSATWGVYSPSPYIDYMIDAETGEILLVGVRSD